MIIMMQQNSTWRYVVVSAGLLLALHLARPHIEQMLQMDPVQPSSDDGSTDAASEDQRSTACTDGGGSCCSISGDGNTCESVEDVQNCLFSNAKRFLSKAQSCKDIITQFQHVSSAKCCIELVQTTVEADKQSPEIGQLHAACSKWLDDIKARMMTFVQQDDEDALEEGEEEAALDRSPSASNAEEEEEEIEIPLTRTGRQSTEAPAEAPKAAPDESPAAAPSAPSGQ